MIGLLYSFFRLFNGHGGSGLYDFFDALAYSSIILFVTSLTTLVFNIKDYKAHRDAFIFLALGFPLTMIAGLGTVVQIYNDRTPDLTVKYELPVSREQYLLDSAGIKVAIDSMIALKNRRNVGPRISYGAIDTIIYSQKGDKIFVSYMKQYEPNNWGNDLDPDYLGADGRDSAFWRLTNVRYIMSGSFHDERSLKVEVRKFYFNQFSFLEKDSATENYFWKVVLDESE